MSDTIFYVILTAVMVVVLLAIMAENTEGFNMSMLTKWPQYTRASRPFYDSSMIQQETIPYLRSGQPLQSQQLVVRDSRCYEAGFGSCDEAKIDKTIADQQVFWEATQSGLSMTRDRTGNYGSSRIQKRSAVNEKFIVSREDVISNSNRAVERGNMHEFKSADARITGATSVLLDNLYTEPHHGPLDDNQIGAVNRDTWDPRNTYSDLSGRESTGLVFAPVTPANDVYSLPQNHPAILSEKHRIATQVNNWLHPIDVRKNLEKTLIADVLRYRQIPNSFGGA